MTTIIETYKSLTHPLVFFNGWTEADFKSWVRKDMYGLDIDNPDEKCLLVIYEMVEPFNELSNIQDYCLNELKNIEIKRNKNNR